tara:strand:- start:2249 stop:3175 length:927 start_codon:yes stop_codon:yes gene_type:complete
MNSQIFFSKILLFGEYGILKNSKAISIPFHKYQGNLEFGDLTNNDVKKSNKSISNFFNFLKKSNQKNNFNSIQFEMDIKRGLFFKSSIPIGYGLGSSGALVSAVYNQYFFNKIEISEDISSNKLIKLKEVFSEIESYFHEKSSGIDPLNSYIGSPILIESKDEIKIIKLPFQDTKSNRGLFIIDSGKPAETGNLIKIFLDSFKDNYFSDNFQKKFILPTNHCVDSLIKSEFNLFSKNFMTLSQFVMQKLNPMIPSVLNKIWKRGLNTGSYYLKLCGSGGGGYLIGFSNDLNKAKKELIDYKFEVIIRI